MLAWSCSWLHFVFLNLSPWQRQEIHREERIESVKAFACSPGGLRFNSLNALSVGATRELVTSQQSGSWKWFHCSTKAIVSITLDERKMKKERERERETGRSKGFAILGEIYRFAGEHFVLTSSVFFAGSWRGRKGGTNNSILSVYRVPYTREDLR